ncbi:MAG: type II toxin-antitoxin system VapC family toxin [Candidatus Binatia bacterium]
MALIVLDASVVIAFLDAGDVHHRAAVAVIAETQADDRVLPASAYAEVMVAPLRRGEKHADKVDSALSSLAVRIEPITRDVARAAAALRARHKTLRLPDALVVAAGDVLDAASVVTADGRWRNVSARVRTLSKP